MFARPGLVQEWQMRLTAWKQRLQDGGGSHPWLAKIYVRVLSFMVASYGSDDSNTGDVALSDPATSRSESPREADTSFFAADLTDAGKAPRSSDQIRSVLQAVRRQQNRNVDQGPLAGGLAENDEIAVAGFYSQEEIRRLQHMLADVGVPSHVRRARKLLQVVISFRDFERARPVVCEHAAEARDTIRARQSKTRLCRQIGTGLGFLIVGFAVMLYAAAAGSGQLDWRHLLAISFLSGIYGAMIGASIGTVVGVILDG